MSILPELNRCTLLHEGGEATAYKVWAGDRPYVLKWYKPGLGYDAHAIDVIMARREDGIFRIRESGKFQGHSFLVYDYVEGLSSAKVSPMDVSVALYCMRRLVAALKSMATEGIYHGDLNPANVMFTVSGPVLIDCGIQGPGVPAYAAPERMKGAPASEKSDIFSLGLLLYSWIAGEDLLKADNFGAFVEAASQVDSLDPTMLLFGKFGMTESLDSIWKGTLRADPEMRVEDLDELDELLEIAFDKTCGGPVKWAKKWEAFAESLKEKSGTEGLESERSCELPARFVGKVTQNGSRRILMAAAIGFILVVMILLAVLLPREPSIDDTGNRMLRESRSLESVVPDTSVTGDSNEFGQ